MASYSTVVSIFVFLFFLWAFQLFAPRSMFAQELVNMPAHELIELVKDPQSDNRIQAIRELARRPMSLDSIVPELAGLSVNFDQRISAAAAKSLSEIGESGVEMLRPLFDKKSKRASLMACSAAQSIGAASKIYIPEFRQLLKNGDRVERRGALFALKGIGDANVELLDEVIASLSDKDFNVRCMACRVLAKYGPKASKAEPKLLELFDNGTPSVRGLSAICLASLGAELQEKDVVDRLVKKLEGDGGRPAPPTVHERYLVALTMLGDEAKKHLPVVRKGLAHRSTLVRSHSAFAIYRITGKPDEALAVVEELLKDPLRAPEVLELVGKLEGEAAPFVPAVSRSIDSTSAETREMAVVALTELGINDPATIKKIEGLLEDPEPDVRSAAQEALDYFKWKREFDGIAEP